VRTLTLTRHYMKPNPRTILPPLIASMVLLAAGLPPAQAAGAKKKEEKADAAIQVFKRETKDEPEDDMTPSGGPRLKARDMLRVYQTQAQAKRHEAIRTLKEIIRDTPDDDPQKPEYFFRLSELYWSMASFYTLRAFGYDDEIWETEKSDPARHEQLKRLKQEDLDRSRQYRADTLRVYQAIRQSFPKYVKMDEVLFYMGFNYKEMGESDQAQSAFIELIKKHPQSRYIPDAWLQFGEFFFEIDEMERAYKAYDKAARFKDAKVYGFATYKRGWCAFNLGRFKPAMKDFLEVIRYSNNEGKRDKNRISLVNEATKDLVTVYSRIGTGGKAIGFFKKVAPDRWADLVAKLARLYTNTGKVKDANALYRQLIRVNKGKPEIIDYEFAIARNVESIGDKSSTTLETKRLVGLFRKMRDEGILKGKKLKKSSQKIREMLREMSTTWHREAQVTKNAEYLPFAYEMYQQYVEAFPDAEDIYVMTFYLAELLYRVGKWRQAAEAYDRVIRLDPKGKYARDAAHASVLAYQKLLDLHEREQKRGDKKASAEAGVPEKKEIDDSAKQFLTACDNYIKLVPDGDRGVDVEYFAALIYYDHNQFDEAISRFKAIIKTHPKHRLAYYSANLVLDSYNLKGDFTGLNAAVKEYYENPDIARGKLLANLQTLREGAAFKDCMQLEKERKSRRAAKCFDKFAVDFATSAFFDKAIYNAALNYERVNDIANAIRLRMKLLRERPDSDLGSKALFAIAGNLHASAVYSEASKYYELYAKNFPKEKDAEVALANAAVFRRGLGQYDKAIKDYQEWVRRYAKKKPKQAAEVEFSIGDIYVKQARKKELINHYRNFLRRWGKQATDDRVIQAHTHIGMAALDLKRKKDAAQAFARAVKTFNGLPKGRQKKLVDGREAGAHARFMEGEALFKSYEDYAVDSRKHVVQQVTEKLKRLLAAKAVYDSVIAYGHPNWAIAAIGRNAAGFQMLANAVRNSPRPKGLNDEELMVYDDELEKQAAGFDSKAAENYVTVLKLAAKYQWFNEWTGRAEKELQLLMPEEYTLAGELRAEPDLRSEGFRSARFSTEKEEQP